MSNHITSWYVFIIKNEIVSIEEVIIEPTQKVKKIVKKVKKSLVIDV